MAFGYVRKSKRHSIFEFYLCDECCSRRNNDCSGLQKHEGFHNVSESCFMYTPVVGPKDKEWRFAISGNQNAIKILVSKIENGV